MPKSEKKTLPSRFHEALHPLRKDVAGLDIGAEEIWVDVGAENDSEPVPGEFHNHAATGV